MESLLVALEQMTTQIIRMKNITVGYCSCVTLTGWAATRMGESAFRMKPWSKHRVCRSAGTAKFNLKYGFRVLLFIFFSQRKLSNRQLKEKTKQQSNNDIEMRWVSNLWGGKSQSATVNFLLIGWAFTKAPWTWIKSNWWISINQIWSWSIIEWSSKDHQKILFRLCSRSTNRFVCKLGHKSPVSRVEGLLCQCFECDQSETRANLHTRRATERSKLIKWLNRYFHFFQIQFCCVVSSNQFTGTWKKRKNSSIWVTQCEIITQIFFWNVIRTQPNRKSYWKLRKYPTSCGEKSSTFQFRKRAGSPKSQSFISLTTDCHKRTLQV